MHINSHEGFEIDFKKSPGIPKVKNLDKIPYTGDKNPESKKKSRILVIKITWLKKSRIPGIYQKYRDFQKIPKKSRYSENRDNSKFFLFFNYFKSHEESWRSRKGWIFRKSWIVIWTEINFFKFGIGDGTGFGNWEIIKF